MELSVKELEEINGGGVGGFLVGYFIGSTVALVGAPVLCAMGKQKMRYKLLCIHL